MRLIKNILTGFILIGLISGCSGMNKSEQRMLSGGAIGAGAGAAVGAISGGSAVTGAIVGGAAGVAGGAIVNDKDR